MWNFFRIIIPLLLALFYFSLLPEGSRRAPWYQEIFFNALIPFEWTLNHISGGIKGVWNKYIFLVNLKEENEQLKKENASLKSEILITEGIKKENERLLGLLSHKENIKIPTLSARVIINDPTSEFKSLTIDKGSDERVDILMPVIGPSGLVGRTERVFYNYSQILLLTDPNSAVDVQVQRSGARALLVGLVKRTELRPVQYLTNLEYLENRSDVETGDIIITSGFDGIFPHGLPVGRVGKITMSAGAVFKSAEVIPLEDFGVLSEVLVLLKN